MSTSLLQEYTYLPVKYVVHVISPYISCKMIAVCVLFVPWIFFELKLVLFLGASSIYNRLLSAASFCFYSHYIIHLSCKDWLYFLQEGLRRTIESYPHLRAEHGSRKDGPKSSAALFKRIFLMVITNTYNPFLVRAQMW